MRINNWANSLIKVKYKVCILQTNRAKTTAKVGDSSISRTCEIQRIQWWYRSSNDVESLHLKQSMKQSMRQSMLIVIHRQLFRRSAQQNAWTTLVLRPLQLSSGQVHRIHRQTCDQKEAIRALSTASDFVLLWRYPVFQKATDQYSWVEHSCNA